MALIWQDGHRAAGYGVFKVLRGFEFSDRQCGNDKFSKGALHMRVCGCEISASEVRLAVVHHDDEGGVEMLRLGTTRLELNDDTSEADLRSVLADLQEFAQEHEIDVFAIKTRAKKGRMAGGAVSFKIETLIQLVEGSQTKFVNPVALSHFAKNDLDEYPEKLPVYLKNAFLSGAYALTKPGFLG